VVVVQPTLVYGPFSPHWTITPVRHLTTGLVPLLDGGVGYCNAVYIDDAVDAMILAASQPNIVGETFVISGAEPVTWKEFYGAFESALGIHATVEMSELQLREAMRTRQGSTHSLGMVLRLVRQPEVASQLLALPIVQTPLKFLRNHLSDARWESFKVRMLRGNAPLHEQNGPPGKTLYLPDETLLNLYNTQTHVRIDKAKQLLGYTPQVDFTRGMGMTMRFVQWANLV
jgi:nucleoside-diphosphate-sugar epimerase